MNRNSDGLLNLKNVTVRVANFKEIFKNLDYEPEFINDMQVTTESEAASLKDRLITTYQTDTLDDASGFNPLFEPIRPDLWMRPPPGVDALMPPNVKIMLGKAMMCGKGDGLRWCCDPYYKLPPRYEPVGGLKKLIDGNVPRGLNYFHRNFDDIMELFFSINSKRASKSKKPEILQLIEKYRDCIFSDVLPYYSKHAFVLEKTEAGTSADTSVMTMAIDAATTLTSIPMDINVQSHKRMESKAYKVMDCMAKAGEAFAKKQLNAKEGVFRKSSYGSLTSYNARMVITSNQLRNHDYRTLRIPWGVGMVLFAQHIGGILIRDFNYTVMDVFNMRARYAKQFDPFLYRVMMDHLSSYEEGGAPAVFLRNPTLERLAHQWFIIPEVKTDPDINTTDISNLAIKGPNADFDGDEMNLLLLIDKKMSKAFERLSPHYGAMDLNEPLTFSSNLALPKSMATKLHRFLGYHLN